MIRRGYNLQLNSQPNRQTKMTNGIKHKNYVLG